MMMPYRDFLVRQAVLNACYPGATTASWLPIWMRNGRLPAIFVTRVQNEFRKIAAQYEAPRGCSELSPTIGDLDATG